MSFASQLKILGFSPKEGVAGIFVREFKLAGAKTYVISVDVPKQSINYGKKIQSGSATTQNFSQAENWVVLECVCRLLGKGYPPESMVLEKTWPSGHGKSARLDICVHRSDTTDYLLIECKTWGAEYDKALAKMQKDGGQLFTYFKFSNQADVIMLYTSEIGRGGVQFRNDIIPIQEDYRLGDVQDFYKVWNKLSVDNGVFEPDIDPYQFRSKYLIPEDLKDINHADSSLIFNQFLEILRHNVVSDKPNAFNKIFTLFLCKVYDEKSTLPGQKLRFQWEEGVDDDVSFQLRLTDLYQEGMKEFLDKDVTDISEKEIRKKYQSLQDNLREELLQDFKKLRLEKNNEFAIKEVFDSNSFADNAKVVKEVVQLLQKFRIRYNKRQQYLSDFFEQLLTTGLKQEAGQFFTPVPIAQFIIKSLPVREITQQKLKAGGRDELLPYVMDYAAGSGHFLTEIMHELQRYVDSLKTMDFIRDTKKSLDGWQSNHFDWAEKYIYGVEKDYRLVKVGKVGCYLHGDGLANIVHSDGLGSFAKTHEYKERLSRTDRNFPKENQQFDIVISNPPYSVEAFKGNARKYYDESDFTLYHDITDDSSAIECLFIERTQQLLKEGGVAGIILPRSILSNGGVYEKARSLLLKYFDLIAIAELGSNTFMATGTNTVTLFMRRRDNYIHQHIESAIDHFLINLTEVTINGMEQPISAYLAHVWGGLALADYITLLQKNPNSNAQAHELYQWIDKNLRAARSSKKSVATEMAESDYWFRFVKLEREKLVCFIRAYSQQVVIVKSGEKDVEKQFLGYTFSDRRGHEGIHPMRGAHIDECTKLFHPERFDDPERASTYILQAFNGDLSQPIHPSLEQHVYRARLVDMIDFGRAVFERTVSLAVKKKADELKSSLWQTVRMGDVTRRVSELIDPKEKNGQVTYIGLENIESGTGAVIGQTSHSFDSIESTKACFKTGDILYGKLRPYLNKVYLAKFSGICSTDILVLQTTTRLNASFLRHYMLSDDFLEQVIHETKGVQLPRTSWEKLQAVRLPLPPIETQKKIVETIEAVEGQEVKARDRKSFHEKSIRDVLDFGDLKAYKLVRLGDVAEIISGGTPNTKRSEYWDGDICWATLVDTKQKYLYGTQRKITEDGVKNSSAKLLPVDTVIFSSRATIGDLSIAKVETCTNQGYKNFVCNKSLIAPEYLYYALLKQKETISELASGMTYKEISKEKISNVQIPLPSLKIQNQLIAEIAILEEKIAKEESLLAALAQERNTILECALYENIV